MLENIIIGMALENPITGYDIKKYIENGISVFYKASFGSLYPALKKLTQKGYLTMVEQQQGNRKKKFYQATEDGKLVFYEWLALPVDLNDTTESRLVKIYFFDILPPEIRDQQLKEYELNNLNYLRKLEFLEKQFNEMPDRDCFYFKLSTLYYGICIIQENIRWCRHLQEHKPLKKLIER